MNKIFSEKYVSSISILWIIIMACLLILKRNTLGELGLNEIGDALAGAFAPLGFFWLVAGFYQQGKGLEQNSAALNMQAEELKFSTQALQSQVEEMKATVDQQKILAEFQRLEIEERHKAVEPSISLHASLLITSIKQFYIIFEIRNIDHNNAKNIVLHMNCAEMNTESKPYSASLIIRETKTIKELFTEVEHTIYKQQGYFERYVELSYENIYGREYRQSYKLEIGNYQHQSSCSITRLS